MIPVRVMVRLSQNPSPKNGKFHVNNDTSISVVRGNLFKSGDVHRGCPPFKTLSFELTSEYSFTIYVYDRHMAPS